MIERETTSAAQVVEGRALIEPIQTEDKPGRNDPCPCGSGKKFKRCCL